jgi:hypothetical protein
MDVTLVVARGGLSLPAQRSRMRTERHVTQPSSYSYSEMSTVTTR